MPDLTLDPKLISAHTSRVASWETVFAAQTACVLEKKFLLSDLSKLEQLIKRMASVPVTARRGPGRESYLHLEPYGEVEV